MAGTTNYPGALDTTTNLPIASALVTVELDGDGDVNKIHSNLHGVLSQAAVAIEGKIGTGASTPIANRVLRGSGTGTSAWAQVALATDVSGTLPLASLATGALDSGFSITSGFGTINNGASSITTTGALAAGATTLTGGTGTALIATATGGADSVIIRDSDTPSTTSAVAYMRFQSSDASSMGYFGFASGSNQDLDIVNSVSNGNIDLTPGSGGTVNVAAGVKFSFSGDGGDTYIYEESTDDLHVVVGGAIMVAIDQAVTNIGIGNATDVVADTMVSVNGSFSHGSPGAFQVEAALTTTSAGTAAKHFLVGGSGSSITTNFAGTGVAGRISTAEFFEPNITLGTSDTVTLATTVFINNAPTEGVTNAALYVASGEIIGLGKATIGSGAASVLDISPLTAGADLTFSTGTFATSHLSLLNTGNGAINKGASIAMGGSKRTGSFGAAGFAELKAFKENGTDNNQAGYFAINTNSNASTLTERFRIDSAGTAYIGDTLNGNMTVGLTINQGANDDQAFALKSSDVGHPMTGVAEADTYFQISKSEGGSGGVMLRSFKDADGGNNSAMLLRAGLGETADTTDTSSSRGVMEYNVEKTDGGTGVTALGATENGYAWHNAFTARMLLKGNGDLHITNTTLTALDGEDDIGLIRTYQKESSSGMGIAMSKWDADLKTNRADLIRTGVWSSEGDFTIQQRMNDLLGGGIWQLNTKHMSLVEEVEALRGDLAIANSKLNALGA